MISAVIGLRRVEAKRILTAQLVRNRVEHLLNLTAAIDETFRQQEGAAAAVLRKGAQHVQVDFVTLALWRSRRFDRTKSSEQTRSRDIRAFGVCESGNTDRIDQHLGLS